MTIFGNLNTGGFRLEELGASAGEMIGASASQAIEDLPTVSFRRILELEDAKLGGSPGQSIERVLAGEDPADVLYGASPAVNRIAIADAKQRVKEAGLEKDLHLPDQGDIAEPALQIMLDRAKARRERNLTIARGPDGFIPNAAAFGTSFLLQAIDPINVASAFIPVVGEARYAQILAGAGKSLVRRAAARASLGAAEGAVGAAMVEPLIARAKLQEGADYTFGDFLTSIAFGAGLGTGLHVGFGGARDVYRARRGDAQYPFGPGEPLERPSERPAGADSGAFARSSGADQADLAGQVEITHGRVPDPVSAALDDLPGPVKQDLLQGAIATISRGEPVRAGEMLDAAVAGGDWRIAESLALSDRFRPVPKNAEMQVEAQTPRAISLFEFLASKGGLKYDAGGDLKYTLDINPIVPRHGRLIRRQGGMSLDEAREAAVQAGYLADSGARDGGVTTSTINDLLEALGQESRGQKVYREGESGRSAEDALAEFEHEVAGQFRAAGLDPSSIDERLYNRTLQIMHREGERDALAAYERAVMEDADRYDALPQNAQPAGPNMPGWDLPDNAAWRRLSEQRSPFDEPDIREASQAADHLAEPKSLVKSERVAAAERAAAQAEEIWKANEAYITDDLKAKVDAELHALDLEVKDRTQVLQQGAACLAAAIG